MELLERAHCGDLDGVKRLIQQERVDVNTRNEYDQTALYCACEQGHTDMVQYLLDSGAAVSPGAKPLVVAVRNKHLTVVQLLLEHGTHPDALEESNESSNCRSSPMHIAAADGNSELVELLLKHGASVDVADSDGNTALHLALKHYRPRATSSQVEAVNSVKSVPDILLENKADVNALNSSGETPLHRAALRGLFSIVGKMLEVCGGNPNRGSPLAGACLAGNVKVADMLLRHGADPNQELISNYDHLNHKLPLLIAVENDNSELVELLLKHGANVDATDSEGDTALHYAVEVYQETPSHCAHQDGDSMSAKSITDILLENKADVNVVNNNGETPLYTAVSCSSSGLVSRMLQVYGGDPNKGSLDSSPLAVACQMQNVELVDILLKHGADPNRGVSTSKYHNPLVIAVRNGNCDIVKALLNAGICVNAVTQEGKSTVCYCAENLITSSYDMSTKQLTAIRLLLQHGAHFNMPHGRFRLCQVVNDLEKARRGHRYRPCDVELLQLMVKHGAVLLESSSQTADYISRLSLNSETLIDLATFDGKHEFIVDMLQAGAGFRLIASCCNDVATGPWKAKSLCLCQAAILAGYTPSAEELQNLQLAAASDVVLDQLMIWLNEERKQPPSLLRQCRVVIRRQLSFAVHYQTILPAINKLPLPNDMKLYLQFDGKFSEVDFSVDEELQTTETSEESSMEGDSESRDYLYDYTDSEYSCDDFDSNALHDYSDTDSDSS